MSAPRTRSQTARMRTRSQGSSAPSRPRQPPRSRQPASSARVNSRSRLSNAVSSQSPVLPSSQRRSPSLARSPPRRQDENLEGLLSQEELLAEEKAAEAVEVAEEKAIERRENGRRRPIVFNNMRPFRRQSRAVAVDPRMNEQNIHENSDSDDDDNLPENDAWEAGGVSVPDRRRPSRSPSNNRRPSSAIPPPPPPPPPLPPLPRASARERREAHQEAFQNSLKPMIPMTKIRRLVHYVKLYLNCRMNMGVMDSDVKTPYVSAALVDRFNTCLVDWVTMILDVLPFASTAVSQRDSVVCEKQKISQKVMDAAIYMAAGNANNMENTAATIDAFRASVQRTYRDVNPDVFMEMSKVVKRSAVRHNVQKILDQTGTDRQLTKTALDTLCICLAVHAFEFLVVVHESRTDNFIPDNKKFSVCKAHTRVGQDIEKGKNVILHQPRAARQNRGQPQNDRPFWPSLRRSPQAQSGGGAAVEPDRPYWQGRAPSASMQAHPNEDLSGSEYDDVEDYNQNSGDDQNGGGDEDDIQGYEFYGESPGMAEEREDDDSSDDSLNDPDTSDSSDQEGEL